MVSDQDSEQDEEAIFGPFIQLTFHSNFIELLHEFYGTITFVDDSFKAGGLVFKPYEFDDDFAAQQEIAHILGIQPEHTTDSSLSFVLASYKKIVSNLTATFDMKEDYVSDYKNLSRSEANDILSLFPKYGTHLISKISKGDFIYQVYVYERSVFDYIEENYPDDPLYRYGFFTSEFRSYTKPRVHLPDGTYTGYTKYVGNITAASQDPVFEEIRPKLYDDIYHINSILIFYIDISLPEKIKEMKSLIDHTELCSIAKLVYSAEENETQDAYEEVLKGAVFQVFDDGSSPEFETVEGDPLLTHYQYFNPNLVTKTATSFTAIVEVNFDLTDLDILNKQFVTDLLIVADTIELPMNAKVDLPGTQNVTLVCRQFTSFSTSNSIPQITVSSEATFSIVASTFKGVMKLLTRHSKKYITYIGGSVFVTISEGNVHSDTSKEFTYPWPSAIPDFYTSSPSDYREKWIVNTFLNGMDLEIITVESVYSLQITDSTAIAQKTLKWIISTLTVARNETELSTGLERILSRALLLDKMNPNPQGAFILVPKLKFELYQDLYDSQLANVDSYEDKLANIAGEISTRLQTEEITNNQQELNENILSIGKFLVNMVSADSKFYEDVNNTNGILNSKKFKDLQAEMDKAAELYNEVLEYNKEVAKAGKEFGDAVQKYVDRIKRQIIFSVIRGIGSMFLGIFDMATISVEIQGIARVAKKVSYVIKLAEQLETLYDSIRTLDVTMGSVNDQLDRLSDMSDYQDTFPTYMDWNDFEIDIEYVTSFGYIMCCGMAAAKYKDVAMKLSTRGKTLLNSLQVITDLQYDIITNQLYSDVAAQQMDRLQQLAETLNLDHLTDYQANTTNLFELGNILQTKANNIRMQLARTYLTMDSALQYDKLKPPTPLSGYDTSSIQSQASNQMSDALYTYASFPAQPVDLDDPAEYEIKDVPISNLTSENGYTYNLPLDSSEFFDYIRVRIVEIQVTMDSVESTDGKGIFILSNFTGHNFHDRGLERETKTYNTYKSIYNYAYNFETGKTMIGNRPSTDDFERMTPFGEWIFSIPKIESETYNVNITYSRPTTTLKIKFYLNVIFHPSYGSTYPIVPPNLLSSYCQSEQCILKQIYKASSKPICILKNSRKLENYGETLSHFSQASSEAMAVEGYYDVFGDEKNYGEKMSGSKDGNQQAMMINILSQAIAKETTEIPVKDFVVVFAGEDVFCIKRNYAR